MNFSNKLIAAKTLNAKIAKMLEMLNINEPVSRIEQVLMLDYTNQLHEFINTFDTEKVQEVSVMSNAPINIDKVEQPKPIPEIGEAKHEVENTIVEFVGNAPEVLAEDDIVIEEVIEAVDEKEPVSDHIELREVAETAIPKEFKAEKIENKLNKFTKPEETKLQEPKEELVHEEVNNLFDQTSNAEIFKTVSSIKSAIGLNERFAFVENLFSGNGEAFNQFIDKLDNDNFDAKQVLSEKAKTENWKPDNEYFKYLKNMVHLD